MPMRPPTPCGERDCPDLVYGGGGRCPKHLMARRAASTRFRREHDGDLYARGHRRRFRPGVLRKHPYCQCERTDHAWHREIACPQPSTDADHWPVDKRTLIALGLDSDDPQHGRGLCRRCHSSATARLQPGGWHKPALSLAPPMDTDVPPY